MEMKAQKPSRKLIRHVGLTPIRVMGTRFSEYVLEEVETNNLELIFNYTEPRQNEWHADYKLEIYQGPNGFGLYEEIPQGYTKSTYELFRTMCYYDDVDFDWFLRYALDSDQRYLVEYHGVKVL